MIDIANGQPEDVPLTRRRFRPESEASRPRPPLRKTRRQRQQDPRQRLDFADVTEESNGPAFSGSQEVEASRGPDFDTT
jgi:hypothetical protein